MLDSGTSSDHGKVVLVPGTNAEFLALMIDRLSIYDRSIRIAYKNLGWMKDQ
jgi:hypothetical protein